MTTDSLDQRMAPWLPRITSQWQRDQRGFVCVMCAPHGFNIAVYDVFGLHQTRGCFGPFGHDALALTIWMFEILRHVGPLPAGGRLSRASTRAINRRRGAGSSGFAGTQNASKSAAGNFVWRYGRKTA